MVKRTKIHQKAARKRPEMDLGGSRNPATTRGNVEFIYIIIVIIKTMVMMMMMMMMMIIIIITVTMLIKIINYY